MSLVRPPGDAGTRRRRHQREEPGRHAQTDPACPGHPGATLLHVIGCTPSDRTLTREEALAALRQPRAAACIECDAARSLPPEQRQADQDHQTQQQRDDESRQDTNPSATPP
ncbi:DUF6233 domain-containing protein [Streptomyces sp. NPDC001276]|uniref:DUF6233 domain-containing protein n=1 Tax=Streptomyces sp. NPDC001276 TaxID=3364555 RepID=UPI0036CC25E1